MSLKCTIFFTMSLDPKLLEEMCYVPLKLEEIIYNLYQNIDKNHKKNKSVFCNLGDII